MPNVEFYAKLKIHEGQLQRFKRRVDAIVHTAGETGSATLRCDWYINEEKNESVAMVVYKDDASMQLHHSLAASHFDHVADCCDASLEFLGAASAAAQATMSRFNPRVLAFAYGINPTSTTLHGALTSGSGIEIYTRFDIFPEHFEGCKAVGAELIPIIRSKDPGTTRYDWFYDEANLQGVAMDAYVDTPSMFAHMKNAHDVHEKLFDHSTMITEFLGELPQDAKAAVARYNPYILPLYAGLKPVV